MENSRELRHKIIENLMASHTEKVAKTAINLWQQMATQIISIIGEGGFESLYARSIFLSRSTFPWLALAVSALPPQMDTDLAVNPPPSPPINHWFAILEMSFEGRTPEQISAANSLLLITFIHILDSLIGEQLTTRILDSAWNNHALEKTSQGVEK